MDLLFPQLQFVHRRPGNWIALQIVSMHNTPSAFLDLVEVAGACAMQLVTKVSSTIKVGNLFILPVSYFECFEVIGFILFVTYGMFMYL